MREIATITGANEEQFRMKDNRGKHRPIAEEESQMGHVSNAEKEVGCWVDH